MPAGSLTRVTRRRFLAGLAAASVVVPRPGRAAPAAEPEMRLLRAATGEAALRGPDRPATPIWGYDGVTPGPLLRVRRGGRLHVRLDNALPEATTIHWHGVRIANAMDGVPHLTQPPVAPGSTFDYRFVAPDAGTFWYHPHLFASEQLERGLSGLLIVDETEPVDVDRDVALLLDDWRLAADGTVDVASFRSLHDAAHLGRIGSELTVNGAPAFTIPVRTNERLRLRLVNGANARIFDLRLDRHEAYVMAVDGQPAEPFVLRGGRLLLAPGNRVDLFVDATLPAGSEAALFVDLPGGALPIARLVYEAGDPARPTPRPEPPALPANPLPERMDFARALRRDIPMDGGAMRPPIPDASRPAADRHFSGAPVWSLAGRASDGHSGPPLFSVKRGRTVMLAFQNRTAWPHAMHIHGHHFRLLDNLDDGWKPYWLDTLLIARGETGRIAFVADNPGKWMIHCHMLEHQETGMAAWFEVT